MNGLMIRSKASMNVLRVLFDSKLQWIAQTGQAINKAKRALHGIRLIRQYFNKTELRQLLTSNYFSILYYNSEIWMIPSLNQRMQQKLMSASGNALRTCESCWDSDISFKNLHKMNKRTTPKQMMVNRHAPQLFKVYNTQD